MNEEEMFEQLYDLISDRRSLISDDKEASKIFEKDIKAIETIIKNYKTNEMCLKGYRESILRQCENQLSTVEDIIQQNEILKEKLQKSEKQLEQYQEETCLLDILTDENIKLKNQQKEFIKYLEDELNLIDNVYLLEETDEDVRGYLLIQHDIFKNLVEDLKDSIKRLNKVPTFNDLLKENQQLKDQLQQSEEIIEEAKVLIENHNNLERELQGTIRFNLVKLSNILNKYKKGE